MLSGCECLKRPGTEKAVSSFKKLNQVFRRFMIYSPLCKLALLRHADPGCRKPLQDLIIFLQMTQMLFCARPLSSHRGQLINIWENYFVEIPKTGTGLKKSIAVDFSKFRPELPEVLSVTITTGSARRCAEYPYILLYRDPWLPDFWQTDRARNDSR